MNASTRVVSPQPAFLFGPSTVVSCTAPAFTAQAVAGWTVNNVVVWHCRLPDDSVRRRSHPSLRLTEGRMRRKERRPRVSRWTTWFGHDFIHTATLSGERRIVQSHQLGTSAQVQFGWYQFPIKMRVVLTKHPHPFASPVVGWVQSR